MLGQLGTLTAETLGRNTRAVAALRPVYGWCLRAAYGRRGLQWTVNGEQLRIDPEVRHLVPRECEPVLFDFLRATIHRGNIVVDVGSFLGVYAMMQARWAGETGRVLAFEPSPSSFSVLMRHLEMNGLRAPRVDARCAAVADGNGYRELIVFEEEPYRNMIAGDASSGHHSTIPVVTLDTASASLDRPPDLIRIDVQGLEFAVLRGARELIREGRGRTTIVAEMHPAEWPRYGVDARTVVDQLAELGLSARGLASASDPFAQDAHAILEYL